MSPGACVAQLFEIANEMIVWEIARGQQFQLSDEFVAGLK